MLLQSIFYSQRDFFSLSLGAFQLFRTIITGINRLTENDGDLINEIFLQDLLHNKNTNEVIKSALVIPEPVYFAIIICS